MNEGLLSAFTSASAPIAQSWASLAPTLSQTAITTAPTWLNTMKDIGNYINKNSQGIGTVLGGLGQIYGGYNQQRMANKQFDLQNQMLQYNQDQEKKRLQGLGSLGSYYGGVSNVANNINNSMAV